MPLPCLIYMFKVRLIMLRHFRYKYSQTVSPLVATLNFKTISCTLDLVYVDDLQM